MSRAWAIVGALSVTETVSWGVLYYAFAAFLLPMERELGFSAAQLTGAYSLALGVTAVAGIAVGRFLDRHSPRLLMTVDRFAARISRRGSRSPMSPLIAARDLCVGEDGLPDEFGAALLRTIGMYPPGSYVRLINGELGVVLAPGRRMNQPQVAVIQGASGLPLSDPILRDTAQPGREVIEAVRVGEVRVTVEADKALALL